MDAVFDTWQETRKYSDEITHSELLRRMREFGIRRNSILYHTLLGYMGLPCNRRLSRYFPKKGVVRPIRYHKRNRHYVNNWDYLYDGFKALGIKVESVKGYRRTKHQLVNRELTIRTKIIQDIPEELVHDHKWGWKNFKDGVLFPRASGGRQAIDVGGLDEPL